MTIEINDIHKTYGSVTALDGVSFTIPAGSTFGVLGTNGAGKTTLFELLVGHDTADAGRITVNGTDVATAGARVRERIGFLPEQVGFPGLLTGREVLNVHAKIRGLGPDRHRRIDDVLMTVGLDTDGDRRVSGYSNGMRTRLGLAAALLAEPPVLVLDEPTAGLDPRGVETFHGLIERISTERDVTVVLSSHVLSEVERLCDEVAILHDGRLCAVESVDTIAGEKAHITVQTATTESVSPVADAARPYGDVRIGQGQVEIGCRIDDVVAVIDAIDSEHMAGLAVDSGGLEDAFHAAIDGAEAGVTH